MGSLSIIWVLYQLFCSNRTWARFDDVGASTTNIENSINAYKVELPDDYNILPTFNVKDLRSYHGEDLRASIFFPIYEGLMQELL